MSEYPKTPVPRLSFLGGLPESLKIEVMAQLRDLWTHSSTALEGNSLTLGETSFLLSEGLTISGKPLKDHQEVVGHARAIDRLYEVVTRGTPLREEDLFALHQSVQTNIERDIYKPVGAWKVERNWARAVTPSGAPALVEYAAPEDVPMLMREWLAMIEARSAVDSVTDAVRDYAELHLAFVRIHPFADGNGRMARLVANLPLLKRGLPPLLIPKESRFDYIRLLAAYELDVGAPQVGGAGLLPPSPWLGQFVQFCDRAYSSTKQLIEHAHAKARPSSNPRPGR